MEKAAYPQGTECNLYKKKPDIKEANVIKPHFVIWHHKSLSRPNPFILSNNSGFWGIKHFPWPNCQVETQSEDSMPGIKEKELKVLYIQLKTKGQDITMRRN